MSEIPPSQNGPLALLRHPILWMLVAVAFVVGTSLSLARGGAPIEPARTPTPATSAAFVHPWTLVGAHAQVPCAACHTTSTKPNTTCSTCHQRPQGLHEQVPHSVASCDTCHKAAGVSRDDAVQTCAICHTDRQQHFPTVACTTCHAFRESAPAFAHPSALAGKHASAPCSGCHTSAAKPGTSCTSCHQPPDVELHSKEVHVRNSCQTCHGTSYDGWVVQRQACLSCHGSDSGYQEKAIHKSTTTSLCQSCHNKFK